MFCMREIFGIPPPPAVNNDNSLTNETYNDPHYLPQLSNGHAPKERRIMGWEARKIQINPRLFKKIFCDVPVCVRTSLMTSQCTQSLNLNLVAVPLLWAILETAW